MSLREPLRRSILVSAMLSVALTGCSSGQNQPRPSEMSTSKDHRGLLFPDAAKEVGSKDASGLDTPRDRSPVDSVAFDMPKPDSAKPDSGPPPGIQDVFLKTITELGMWINARGHNRYYVSHGSLVRGPQGGLHLSACGSVESYVAGALPEWADSSIALDKMHYPADKVVSSVSTNGGLNWSALQDLVTTSCDSTGLCRLDQGACTNTRVKLGAYYYLFFETGIPHPSKPRMSYILGVGVARSQSIDGPYSVWTANGWKALPNTDKWQPIVKPVVTRRPNGDQYMIDWFDAHMTGEKENSYWGAGVPRALVKDDQIYLYYTDVTYQVVAPFSVQTKQATLPYAYLIKSKKLSAVSSDILDYHFDQLFPEGTEKPLCESHAPDNWWSDGKVDPCESEGPNLDTLWGDIDEVRYFPELGLFATFYLTPLAGSQCDLTREVDLLLRVSQDGSRWSAPKQLRHLDASYSCGVLRVLGDEQGHAHLNDLPFTIFKLYQPWWGADSYGYSMELSVQTPCHTATQCAKKDTEVQMWNSCTSAWETRQVCGSKETCRNGNSCCTVDYFIWGGPNGCEDSTHMRRWDSCGNKIVVACPVGKSCVAGSC